MAVIAVVGAGIAGLSAAWHLVTRHPGHEVVVLDGAPRVGGRLHGARVAGLPVDVGAEAMLVRRPEGPELLAELGLDAVHPAHVGASIWSRGARHPMPKGTLMGVPSDPRSVVGLLTPDEVARASDERPVTVDADLAVGDLVERAVGAAVVDRLVEPLLGGVYAGHARRLSAKACVPALYHAAARGSSLTDAARAAAAKAAAADPDAPVFGTLAGGMHRLPGLLTDALERAGARIRLETMVRGLARTRSGWRLTTGPTRDERHLEVDGVVLATPSRPAARLLEPSAPEAAHLIGAVDYASMVIVTYAFETDRATALRGGSGFLVPPVDGRQIKAATFSSAKWPWLAQARPDLTFARVSFGRHGETAALQREDRDLARAGLADLQEAVAERLPAPVDAHVQRWGGGLPQYAVGHGDRVGAARAAIPGDAALAVAGAAYDGVGIPACVASGRAAADRVAARIEPARG